MSEPTVTIPLSDYKRLLEAAEIDEMIVWCEVCKAWLDLNEPARATVEDFTGCWKVASDMGDQALCKSYRATVMEGFNLIDREHDHAHPKMLASVFRRHGLRSQEF